MPEIVNSYRKKKRNSSLQKEKLFPNDRRNGPKKFWKNKYMLITRRKHNKIIGNKNAVSEENIFNLRVLPRKTLWWWFFSKGWKDKVFHFGLFFSFQNKFYFVVAETALTASTTNTRNEIHWPKFAFPFQLSSLFYQALKLNGNMFVELTWLNLARTDFNNSFRVQPTHVLNWQVAATSASFKKDM